MKHDDELDKLEEDIRRLKNKYDQFFTGITKMPPMQDRRNVEVYIFELSKQKIRDNARRFRLTTLLSRYNQYREMWGRKMREREEGPMDFRRRSAALSAPAAPPPEPRAPQPSAAAPQQAGEQYVTIAPGTNGESIRKLYSEIEREHLKLGKLPTVTLEQLDAMVKKQMDLAKEKYNVSSVAFRVETVDGKVKLKAKPLQGQQ